MQVLGAEMTAPDDVAALVSAAGRVEAGLRPEDVAVADGPAPGYVEGRVLVVEPMGSETVVILDCAGQRVTARTAPDLTPETGSAVWVVPDLARAVFFDTHTGRRIPVGAPERPVAV